MEGLVFCSRGPGEALTQNKGGGAALGRGVQEKLEPAGKTGMEEGLRGAGRGAPESS